MLKIYLDQAIVELQNLIDITEQDIENIKKAKHDELEASISKKNICIKNFEKSKQNLDEELVKMSKINPNLSDILNDDVKQSLGIMREKLNLLHKKNRQYAKLVVSVKEFLDSLTKEMFGIKDAGYSSDGNIHKVL